MQVDGEIDTRGVYMPLCIADLLGILTEELCQGKLRFIQSCQTYEGKNELCRRLFLSFYRWFRRGTFQRSSRWLYFLRSSSTFDSAEE